MCCRLWRYLSDRWPLDVRRDKQMPRSETMCNDELYRRKGENKRDRERERENNNQNESLNRNGNGYGARPYICTYRLIIPADQ
jgi:hypothetical protein